ncbi:hypothetical protein D3C71_24490 [compost metagenome]
MLKHLIRGAAGASLALAASLACAQPAVDAEAARAAGQGFVSSMQGLPGKMQEASPEAQFKAHLAALMPTAVDEIQEREAAQGRAYSVDEMRALLRSPQFEQSMANRMQRSGGMLPHPGPALQGYPSVR